MKLFFFRWVRNLLGLTSTKQTIVSWLIITVCLTLIVLLVSRPTHVSDVISAIATAGIPCLAISSIICVISLYRSRRRVWALLVCIFVTLPIGITVISVLLIIFVFSTGTLDQAHKATPEGRDELGRTYLAQDLKVDIPKNFSVLDVRYGGFLDQWRWVMVRSSEAEQFMRLLPKSMDTKKFKVFESAYFDCDGSHFEKDKRLKRVQEQFCDSATKNIPIRYWYKKYVSNGYTQSDVKLYQSGPFILMYAGDF